ncbi:hypothetical protein niasHS_011764 [Heterodera schachtii]|uniref:Uncharacterized protein n=1 Tax=Heterodera schachtii TaxID=97005 RepID=A0ABD2ITJ8_HETSC
MNTPQHREWEEAGYLPTNSPPQGEVLIHGANVALGYFKDDEKTKEEFVELDGKRWFATGDIGQFREDGSLCTLLPEEGFDQIVPWRIHRFGTGGDGAADQPERGQHLRLWQPAKGLSGRTCGPKSQKLAEKLSLLASPECRNESSWEAICANKEMAKLLQKELQNFVSGKLRREEIPRKVIICAEPWTADSGMLTEALKLKRKNIKRKFAEEIRQLYEGK